MYKLATIGLGLIASGCVASVPTSGGEPAFGGADASSISSPAATAAPSGTVTLTPAALLGKWHKDCGEVLQDGTDERIYDIVDLHFSQQEVTTHIRNFSDPNCTQPYHYAPSVTATARYSVGDIVAGVNLTQVRAIDTATQAYAGAEFEPQSFFAFAIIDQALYVATEDLRGRDGLSPATRALALAFERPFQRLP